MATKRRRPRTIAERRKGNNARGEAPSGAEYPLTGFGGGKVTDRGKKAPGVGAPRGR